MKFKFFNFILVLMFLTSCGTLKSGFVNSKKDNSDEFLVEKKMPLKMPPSFNELPKPIDKDEGKVVEDTIIKDLIKNSDKEKVLSDSNSDLESLVLEKIKDN